MIKLIIALTLTGCLDTEPKTRYAPLEADCAGALDACYKTCQAQLPSPTTACFEGCDAAFYRCIEIIE